MISSCRRSIPPIDHLFAIRQKRGAVSTGGPLAAALNSVAGLGGLSGGFLSPVHRDDNPVDFTDDPTLTGVLKHVAAAIR